MPGPFDTPFESLPESLPVFPLSGALLLPRCRLPLNIFEPRYLRMIEDALSGDRLLGIVQPLDVNSDDRAPVLFEIGCAGRITSSRKRSISAGTDCSEPIAPKARQT